VLTGWPQLATLLPVMDTGLLCANTVTAPDTTTGLLCGGAPWGATVSPTKLAGAPLISTVGAPGPVITPDDTKSTPTLACSPILLFMLVFLR
jgi:hypothetical protein